jgi:Ice-binding-like/Putative peptidoglycan binding domain
MKIWSKVSSGALVISLALGLAGPFAAIAAGPSPVNLQAADNFAILSKTGISTTGSTDIIGDIGVSPAAATSITGFGLSVAAGGPFATSPMVIGRIYAPDYASPAPANLTTAVLDMQTAYTDAAGRSPNVTELGAGTIGGLTLTPGVYKWGTGVTIPTNVTLSGGANDVWIFQIAQNLTVSSGAEVLLTGGAQTSNIFWVVGGQTTLGTSSFFSGTILDQTAVVLNTGAELDGRALAQSAVTLDSNLVDAPTPAPVTATPVPITPSPSPTMPIYTYTPTSTPKPNPTPTPISSSMPIYIYPTPTPSPTQTALQTQLNALLATLHSLQAQTGQQTSSGPAGIIRTITANLQKGSRGNDVIILQQFLVSQNKGPAARALANAGATGRFGELTRTALVEFQKNAGISPALGYFGPSTRSYLNTHY